MKTMKPKLIGSACSLMEILSLIEKKWYWSNVQVDADGYVSCSKGDLGKRYKIVCKGGRYRFEFTNY